MALDHDQAHRAGAAFLPARGCRGRDGRVPSGVPAGVPAMALACALMFAPAVGSYTSAQAAEAAPARGLIVKLKARSADAALGSVVSSRESAQAVRERLAGISTRNRLRYQDSRPAGLDRAHVLNYQRWLSADEAEAQARQLRQDPEVEWVVVNALQRPQAITVNDIEYNRTGFSGGILLGQWWLKARTHFQGGATQPGAPNVSGAWDAMELLSLSPVTVAVLDSGTATHPDLTGRLLPGYDFVSQSEYANDGNGQDADPSDPGDWVDSVDQARNRALFGSCEEADSSWHGTLIAGQLGAVTSTNLNANPNTGVAGMLWQMPSPVSPSDTRVVLPVRIAGKCGALLSDIIDGMLWAAGVNYAGTPSINPYPARVVSLSFGGQGACDPAYQEAIDAMARAGSILVAAAGNSQAGNGAVSPTRPANCTGVLGVTSLRRNGSKADYADQIPHNPGIGRYALATVGGDGATERIQSTGNEGATAPSTSSYPYVVGTSFSTPIVAGIAAMVLSINPRISPQQLLTAMTTVGQGASGHLSSVPGLSQTCSTTQSLGNCLCTTSTCGAGIADAVSAVNWAISTVDDRVTYSYEQPPPGTVGSTSSSSGGSGGGGSSSPWWLAGLAVATLALRMPAAAPARRRAT